MSSVGGPFSSSSSSSSSIVSGCLSQCNFLPEDDYSYLEDDGRWIQSCQKLCNNNSIIHEALIKLLFDLKSKYSEQPEKIKEELLFEEVLKLYFSKELKDGCLKDEKVRKKVRTVFLATIARSLILNDKALNASNQSTGRELFRSKYDFLATTPGNDEELTWLFRFDRAVQYLKKNLSVKRNKLLFLNVAALLEGSPDYMEYNTGGYEKIETKNRNSIVELSTNYQQRTSSRNHSKSGSETGLTSGIASPSQDSRALQLQEASFLSDGLGTSIGKEKRKGKSMLKNMENAKSLLEKYQLSGKQHPTAPMRMVGNPDARNSDLTASSDLPVGSAALIDSYYDDDSEDDHDRSFTPSKQPLKRLRPITAATHGSNIFSSLASMTTATDSFGSGLDGPSPKNDNVSESQRLSSQQPRRQSRRLKSQRQNDGIREKLTIHSSD
jgi:hypothetical protein